MAFYVVIVLVSLCVQVFSQSPACENGKVYSTCGSPCPMTCDNYRNPPVCATVCVAGCFCQRGQVEHNGACVQPSDCSSDTSTVLPTATHDSCALKRCSNSYYCRVSNITGNAVCIPDCSINNGRCSSEQSCEVVSYRCYSRNNEPCDPHLYINCRDPVYVPCGSDSRLACDSEWTYCLQQNKTRRSSCVASCLSDNGNCGEGDVCITVIPSGSGDPTLQCLSKNSLSPDCPAGQHIDQCGNHCQQTCEHVVSGDQIVCTAVCGPPGCVCPRGLVSFRDRCVDPRLCYVLMKYPPAISPLPLTSNRYLYSFTSPAINTSNFDQNSFLRAVRRVLSSRGYSKVMVDLHGIHQDRGLHIVIQLSGSGVDERSSAQFTIILRESSDQFPVPVSQVSSVDVDRVKGLSRTNVIVVAVTCSVVGVLLILAASITVAVCLCCCLSKKGKTTRHKNLKVEVHNALVNEEDWEDEGKRKLEFQS